MRVLLFLFAVLAVCAAFTPEMPSPRLPPHSAADHGTDHIQHCVVCIQSSCYEIDGIFDKEHHDEFFCESCPSTCVDDLCPTVGRLAHLTNHGETKKDDGNGMDIIVCLVEHVQHTCAHCLEDECLFGKGEGEVCEYCSDHNLQGLCPTILCPESSYAFANTLYPDCPHLDWAGDGECDMGYEPPSDNLLIQDATAYLFGYGPEEKQAKQAKQAKQKSDNEYSCVNSQACGYDGGDCLYHWSGSEPCGSDDVKPGLLEADLMQRVCLAEFGDREDHLVESISPVIAECCGDWTSDCYYTGTDENLGHSCSSCLPVGGGGGPCGEYCGSDASSTACTNCCRSINHETNWNCPPGSYDTYKPHGEPAYSEYEFGYEYEYEYGVAKR